MLTVLLDKMEGYTRVAVATAVVAIWVGYRAIKFFNKLEHVSNLPGYRPPFEPLNIPGVLLPTKWWNPGIDWPWFWRGSVYNTCNTETISVVPWFSGRPYIYTSSLEVAKQITHSQAPFVKGEDSVMALLYWGQNVVAADGDVYKRHRRVTGPAFNNTTYEAVCNESVALFREMFDAEGWSDTKWFDVRSINDFTSKYALIIISRCGFGLPAPWAEDRDPDPSWGKLSFYEALNIVSSHAVLYSALPRWVYSLPFKKIRRVRRAYTELREMMKDFVATRKAELGADTDGDSAKKRPDLFSNLVRASEGDAKVALDDEELIGNVFVFMFAGHETTAHTLAATLAMLAMFPVEQYIAVQQINEVLGSRDPTFADIPKLDKVAALFQEGVRMFPAGSILIRDTAAPVTLSLPDTKKKILVPQDMRVVVDMIGVHYNPRHFLDPFTYKPSRWYGVEHDTDFTFFGLGPRMCMGRKVAMTEAVVFLTMLLRDWEVHPHFNRDESMDDWHQRIYQAGFFGLAFGVPKVPLTFVRRKKSGGAESDLQY